VCFEAQESEHSRLVAVAHTQHLLQVLLFDGNTNRLQ
jgi:hypothetical protein